MRSVQPAFKGPQEKLELREFKALLVLAFKVLLDFQGLLGKLERRGLPERKGLV